MKCKFFIWICLGACAVSGLLFGMGVGSVKARAASKITSIKIKGTGSQCLLEKKEKKQLKLSAKQAKAVKGNVRWISSNKAVVSVSQKGVLKGKKYGKAYVYAQTTDGSKKIARLRVRVGRKVRKVKMAVSTLTLDIQKQAKLAVSVTPSNATQSTIKYSSSNKKVASVSQSGVVKARKKGTAVIMAASTDGTNKKARCKVKVQVPSQKVVLEAETSPLRAAVGDTVTLSASVRPANASNQGVNYGSSDPAVAKVSKTGKVTALKEGTAVLRADAADGRSSASVQIEVYELQLRGKKLIAHRGYSSQAPENTLPAFELAVSNGFWGAECDVWKTWDGQFVIMHDSGLERMCGFNIAVSMLKLSEIRGFEIIAGNKIGSYPGLTAPSLEEYLAVMARSTTIHPVIELKELFSMDELQEMVDLTAKYGVLDRTIFISTLQKNLLDLHTMNQLKEGQLQYVYNTGDSNQILKVDDTVVKWCITNKIDLDAQHAILTRDVVSLLHANGRLCNAWTVNDLREAYTIFQNCGIDMLTTEYMLAG